MKNRNSLFLVIGLAIFGITSCGGASTSSRTSNLVCASMESYLSTKALALADAAQGGSATEFIEAVIGGELEVVKSDTNSTALFETYLSAMRKWASAVDQYKVTGQSEALTAAAVELEKEIDVLAPKCTSRGWRFESGWRG